MTSICILFPSAVNSSKLRKLFVVSSVNLTIISINPSHKVKEEWLCIQVHSSIVLE